MKCDALSYKSYLCWKYCIKLWIIKWMNQSWNWGFFTLNSPLVPRTHCSFHIQNINDNCEQISYAFHSNIILIFPFISTELKSKSSCSISSNWNTTPILTFDPLKSLTRNSRKRSRLLLISCSNYNHSKIFSRILWENACSLIQ